MAAHRRNSDPEDPLAGYSGLTLFPRTLASVSNAPKPYGNDDIHHDHNFLKSMPLQSPNKLLEQAKVIVDRSSGLSVSEILSYATSNNINEVVATKVIENLHERRPALGRKRARFSLKPKSSQPTVSLEPSLDIDKLKDPEEFFLAFEKLENAKRELQKQTGGILMDLNQQNLSIASRPRRPGILGRSVKYRHHYSNDIASQETFDENICSPSDYNVQKETTSPDVASQERELATADLQEKELVGSVAKSGKRVNQLLDELLTGNNEELDEDGAITLLQEHLQIKPIDLEKLCLPDLKDVRRIDLKASGAYLPNPRNTLSNVTNLLKGMSSNSLKKRKLAESPIPCIASPTPPKNPLGSIISLKKRILQSNSLIDPFSAHNIDQSQARNASPFGCIKKKKDEINVQKELSVSPKLKSIMIEENGIADVNTSLPELTIGDVAYSSEKTVNDNLSRLGSGVDVGSSGFHADVEGSIRGTCMDNRVASLTLGKLDMDAGVQTSEPIEFNDKMEDVLQDGVYSVHVVKKLNSHQSELEENYIVDVCMNLPEAVVGDVTHSSDKTVHDKPIESGVRSNGFHAYVESSFGGICTDNRVVSETFGRPEADKDAQTNESTEFRHKIEDVLREAVDSVQSDLNMENSNVEKMNSTLDKLDQTSCNVVEDHAADGPSKTGDIVPEQHSEAVQTLIGKPFNEQSKAISRPSKKGKRGRASHRQSLAASGTSWESGVRRSTRIRSRPLEYWKGERFLYGRIHQSLTTVIGIKYESPGSSDGKPSVKVKSFVSDEYKDLVELASRF